MSKRGGKREGAGRPRKLKGNLKRCIFSFDDDTLKALDAGIAYKYGGDSTKYKKAEFIRDLIMDYCTSQFVDKSKKSDISIDSIIASNEIYGDNHILIRGVRVLNELLTRWEQNPKLTIDNMINAFYQKDEDNEILDDINDTTEFIMSKYNIVISSRELIIRILKYHHTNHTKIIYPNSQAELLSE